MTVEDPLRRQLRSGFSRAIAALSRGDAGWGKGDLQISQKLSCHTGKNVIYCFQKNPSFKVITQGFAGKHSRTQEGKPLPAWRLSPAPALGRDRYGPDTPFEEGTYRCIR